MTVPTTLTTSSSSNIKKETEPESLAAASTDVVDNDKEEDHDAKSNTINKKSTSSTFDSILQHKFKRYKPSTLPITNGDDDDHNNDNNGDDNGNGHNNILTNHNEDDDDDEKRQKAKSDILSSTQLFATMKTKDYRPLTFDSSSLNMSLSATLKNDMNETKVKSSTETEFDEGNILEELMNLRSSNYTKANNAKSITASTTAALNAILSSAPLVLSSSSVSGNAGTNGTNKNKNNKANTTSNNTNTKAKHVKGGIQIISNTINNEVIDMPKNATPKRRQSRNGTLNNHHHTESSLNVFETELKHKQPNTSRSMDSEATLSSADLLEQDLNNRNKRLRSLYEGGGLSSYGMTAMPNHSANTLSGGASGMPVPHFLGGMNGMGMPGGPGGMSMGAGGMGMSGGPGGMGMPGGPGGMGMPGGPGGMPMGPGGMGMPGGPGSMGMQGGPGGMPMGMSMGPGGMPMRLPPGYPMHMNGAPFMSSQMGQMTPQMAANMHAAAGMNPMAMAMMQQHMSHPMQHPHMMGGMPMHPHHPMAGLGMSMNNPYMYQQMSMQGHPSMNPNLFRNPNMNPFPSGLSMPSSTSPTGHLSPRSSTGGGGGNDSDDGERETPGSHTKTGGYNVLNTDVSQLKHDLRKMQGELHLLNVLSRNSN